MSESTAFVTGMRSDAGAAGAVRCGRGALLPSAGAGVIVLGAFIGTRTRTADCVGGIRATNRPRSSRGRSHAALFALMRGEGRAADVRAAPPASSALPRFCEACVCGPLALALGFCTVEARRDVAQVERYIRNQEPL
ncbi:hypothetical protein [Paraburkholderia sp. SG-MS1]|uniref:hypothetical protein n=1 Tax=Paraburkholderia sp. SG-MS1 TaxID=2023741 RepID=UPI0014460DCD|nr:hypothetical protein [Paraburkholderia sp. SG-MS1]